MADQIQPENMGTGAGALDEAKKLGSDDEGGEFVLYPVGRNRTVAWFKVDYPASSDARHFTAIYFEGCNKMMFARRHPRSVTDIGAWELRRKSLTVRCAGYVSSFYVFLLRLVS